MSSNQAKITKHAKKQKNMANKKNEIELLVMKTITPEMKNSLYGTNSRLDLEEEKNSEFKDIK